MKQKIVALFALALACAFVPSLHASAGSINTAEQEVIDAAGQPFSYNGKTYKIKGSYISKGESKMADDNVNLTDSEARSYISQLEGAYPELVSEGYCDETKKSGGEEEGESGEEPDATPAPTHSPKMSKENIEFLKLVLGKPTKADRNDAKEAAEAQNAESADGNITDAAQEEDAWQENVLGAVFDFTSKDNKAAAGRDVSVKIGKKEYAITDGGKADMDSFYDMIGIDRLKTAVFVILGVSVAAALISLLIMFAKNKDGGMDKKWLLPVKILCTIGIACACFLILCVFGVYAGMLNKSSLNRQIMESDYFSGVTMMTQDLAKKELKKADYDKNVAEDIFSMSNIYIVEKQHIDDVISGSTKKDISMKKIHKVLTDAFEDDVDVIDGLEEIYADVLSFAPGEIFAKAKSGFLMWAIIILAVSIISASCQVFVLLRCRSSYGAMGNAAAGVLLASVAMLGVSVALRAMGIDESIKLSPVYFEQFAQSYIVFAINAFFYIGCIGLAAAAGLFFLRRYFRDNA